MGMRLNLQASTSYSIQETLPVLQQQQLGDRKRRKGCRPFERPSQTHRSHHAAQFFCKAEIATAQGSGLLQPVAQTVSAFAPATIANLGPGFDWLGCAVDVSCPAANKKYHVEAGHVYPMMSVA